MNNIKIFLLNGPPGSGKDTLANYIVQRDRENFVKSWCAYPMKQAVKAFFALSDEEFKEFEGNTVLKGTKLPRFLGMSYREACISFAEEWCKPTYGQRVFGELLVERIKALNSTKPLSVVISDSGFNCEAEPMVEEFGKDNVFHVKLVRKGCDYVGDSRGYIDPKALGIKSYTIKNKTLEAYYAAGYYLMKSVSQSTKPIYSFPPELNIAYNE